MNSAAPYLGGYLEDRLGAVSSDDLASWLIVVELDIESMIVAPRADFHIWPPHVRPDGAAAFHWIEADLWITLSERVAPWFRREFAVYFAPNGAFSYDNVLHLVMIVKNSGPVLERVLRHNLPQIDRWTILDTGSTDGTVDLIERVLGGAKPGHLYQEPFIDFGASRNRALELAGKSSRFLLMLDDTYMIQGNLRHFLSTIRSDQFADSYSLYIHSQNIQYTSNRITRADRGLRYLYKIHEVLSNKDNVNVIIPEKCAYIYDDQVDELKARTRDRMARDVQMLQDSIREDPTNPRHVYYLAQTYAMQEEYELAFQHYTYRFYHPNAGFDPEKLDAAYEAARIGCFVLERPWAEMRPLLDAAFAADPARPEVPYMKGAWYHKTGDLKRAFACLKTAFEIGYPATHQFVLKATLSYHFVPLLLVPLCYPFKAWQLGLDAARLFLEHSKDPQAIEAQNMAAWTRAFEAVLKVAGGGRKVTASSSKKCVVIHGGQDHPLDTDLPILRSGNSIDAWVQQSRASVCVFVDNVDPLLAAYEAPNVDHVYVVFTRPVTPGIIADHAKLRQISCVAANVGEIQAVCAAHKVAVYDSASALEIISDPLTYANDYEWFGPLPIQLQDWLAHLACREWPLTVLSVNSTNGVDGARLRELLPETATLQFLSDAQAPDLLGALLDLYTSSKRIDIVRTYVYQDVCWHLVTPGGLLITRAGWKPRQYATSFEIQGGLQVYVK